MEIQPNNICKVAQHLMAVERAAWSNPRLRRILKAAPLVVMFLLLNTKGARAACSFNPAPDPTVDGSSNSLRAAVQAANASGQDCLIQLEAGTYTLTIGNTNGQENAAAQGDLDIADSGHTVTIEGNGPKVSIINGNGVNGINDRVFQVLGGANAVFSKLAIEGGLAHDDGTVGALPGTIKSYGGGVLVQDSGHVTLSHVWVEGNRAVGGAGAGFFTCFDLSACPTPGQAAAGGGLFVSAGTVHLRESKIFGNIATGGAGGNGGPDGFGPGDAGAKGGAGMGGGLCVLSGDVKLSRSTVSGDTAAGGPGGNGNGSYGESSSCCEGSGGAGGPGTGGGLYIFSGTAELSGSSVTGNSATGASGGSGGTGFGSGLGGSGGAAQGAGLFVNGGAFRLRRSTVSSNAAQGGAGGIANYIPRATVNASGGPSRGAGLFVASGDISIDNSTLFSNTAKGGSGGTCLFSTSCPGRGNGGDAAGGGLYISSGSISLKGDTVVSNQALTAFELAPQGLSSGGGIANAGATRLVSNTTLIANNAQDSGDTNNGDDVSGKIISSHSLIRQTAGATITRLGGNIFDEDPLLDLRGLKLNGGPTRTVALQIGSPAIDKGDNAVCSAPALTGLASIDQRGYSRFHHGNNLCDIGAFEFYNLLVYPKLTFFEPQPVGQQSQSRNLSIINNQASSVSLSTTIGGNDPADFIENDNCGATLAANASCTIAITFKPAATGNRSAVLSVSDSPDRTSPYTVGLVGEGQ